MTSRFEEIQGASYARDRGSSRLHDGDQVELLLLFDGGQEDLRARGTHGTRYVLAKKAARAQVF